MGLILIPLLIQLRLKSILALKKKLGVESRALKASHDKADLDLIDAKNLRVKKIKDAQPEVLKQLTR
jgi:hypothetical protein